MTEQATRPPAPEEALHLAQRRILVMVSGLLRLLDRLTHDLVAGDERPGRDLEAAAAKQPPAAT